MAKWREKDRDPRIQWANASYIADELLELLGASELAMEILLRFNDSNRALDVLQDVARTWDVEDEIESIVFDN